MRSQLIVGMPNSGKSTYIGALRHLLVAAEVTTELELSALSENEKHLNALEDKWLNCEQVPRTKPATEGWVEFRVKDRQTSVESNVMLPDLRGEAFEQPACISRCDGDLYQAVATADGIMLFTNADREDDSMMTDDLSDILGDETQTAGGEEAPTQTETSATTMIEPPPFVPEKMPEEVKIVEFLQMANRRPLMARRRKLALFISAWDTVQGNPSPSEWFKQNRPMLHQFLMANAELWDIRVYGVSAQGGKLPAQQAELKAVACPSKRIQIIGHDVAAHDLSSPLRWLISGDS